MRAASASAGGSAVSKMNVARAIDEQLDRRRGTGDEAAVRAERLRERPEDDDARIVEIAREARAFRARDAERVRLVEQQHVVVAQTPEQRARDRSRRRPC